MTMRFRGSDAISGQTRELTLGTGRRILWMALGFTLGLMGDNMRASTKMIKSMGMECILGRTLKNMQGGGTTENNMVLEYS